MIQNNKSPSLTRLLITLGLVYVLSITGCGKDGKTGATEAPVNGGPSSLADGSYDEYTGSGDISDPDTQAQLKEILGATKTEELNNALAGLDNPTGLQPMAMDLGRLLAILHDISMKADEKAKTEFIALLNKISQELQELKKNYSKEKMRSFGKRNKKRMGGFLKGLLSRLRGKN